MALTGEWRVVGLRVIAHAFAVHIVHPHTNKYLYRIVTISVAMFGLQEDMTALVSQLFRRSFCECLVYGNSTPEVMGAGGMGVCAGCM